MILGEIERRAGRDCKGVNHFVDVVDRGQLGL